MADPLDQNLSSISSESEESDEEESSEEGDEEVDEEVEDNAAVVEKKSLPADDLICPITHELLWDPVTAEDGHFYEKEAIEEWIAVNSRSPHTNEPIGNRLLPAPQIKSLIETLIQAGVIDGALADAWNEKDRAFRVNRNKDDLIRKAGSGNRTAMLNLARNYRIGLGGFDKDENLAYHLYETARDAGSVKATARVGICFCTGKGVSKATRRGVYFLTKAAFKGSDLASYELGMALADGKYGLYADEKEAIEWLQKASGDCRHMHMTAEQEFDCRVKLAVLLES
ncbi:SAM and U-box domain-containing protein 1 [Seminavis robusta]|uniref:SAM and U-box domain-containing protein 1 n=1 Tax=Seminavis robusta TaxID=568900 RepID=A0A9N8HDH8_9STRA|nr:SAM and U-box domain-containing protein 1 [Seminavis robusta]|eukprot:Sro361_g126480.1 SAM and U-box domain-containing protein 1 (284) ;mRNA; f:22878-23729